VFRGSVRRQERLDSGAQLGPAGASGIQEGGSLLGTGLGQRFVKQRFFGHGRPPRRQVCARPLSMRRNPVRGISLLSLFFAAGALKQLSAQPRAGKDPVAVGGAWGDAQREGRLIAAQPSEVAQLDEPGFDRVALGKLGKGSVEGIGWWSIVLKFKKRMR